MILGLGAFGLLLLVAHPVPGADPAAADEQLLGQAKLPTDGPGLVEYFKQRAASAADEGHIQALVKQLGDDLFEVREAASRQLVAIGARAIPALRKAVSDTDVEVVRRAEECLKHIDEGSSAVTVAAAVRVLAQKPAPGAAEALLNYLPAAESEAVVEEVRSALAALAVRDGKADPALVAALGDKVPVKRAAAGVALARTNLPEQVPAVRKLLQDGDAGVRFRVALELAAARDKEAVPVMIGLLEQLSPMETRRIDELLYRLAADKAPPPPSGTKEAARKAYREAWQKWWDDHGGKVEPARIEEVVRTLGNTLIVLLDQGKALEIDGSGRTRWQVDNLQFPLDAQLLPGDRVLVAEHNGGRVTERNRKNEVVWEKKVDSPLVAQRLANGHTFIATRTQLLEVDKDGKEVASHTRPGGEQIMRAQRLANGDYAVVVQLGVTRYVRLDPTFKEVRAFNVDVSTSGGRIDVLANGHVLVPENNNNRVVELDGQGKAVWEGNIDRPITAVRLPNGNTLVTSMNPQKGAVELDRDGKEVWHYKVGDTRVTRAYRR
jgi:hypothetical protein